MTLEEAPELALAKDRDEYNSRIRREHVDVFFPFWIPYSAMQKNLSVADRTSGTIPSLRALCGVEYNGQRVVTNRENRS